MIVAVHDLRIALGVFVALLLFRYARELQHPMIGYALAVVFAANAAIRLFWLPWVNLRYDGRYLDEIYWAQNEMWILPLHLLVSAGALAVIVIWLNHDIRRLILAALGLLAIFFAVDIWGRLMANWWVS